MCWEERMCERNSGGRLSWLAHGAALDVPLTAPHSVHAKILASEVSQFHSDYAAVTVIFLTLFPTSFRPDIRLLSHLPQTSGVSSSRRICSSR
jgi:hypothetical protein